MRATGKVNMWEPAMRAIRFIARMAGSHGLQQENRIFQ